MYWTGIAVERNELPSTSNHAPARRFVKNNAKITTKIQTRGKHQAPTSKTMQSAAAERRAPYVFSGARTFLSAAACELEDGLDSPPRWNISRCCGQECPRSAKQVPELQLCVIMNFPGGSKRWR